MYYAHMRTINQENFVSGKYKEWALKLQNLVEPAVLIDSNFLSTYGNFKVALETNTPGTNGAPTSPGIFPLMDARANFLKNVLSASPPVLEFVKIPTNIEIGAVVVFKVKISNGGNAYLGYRRQNGDRFLREPLFDDGMHGDDLAGDQIFGTSITISDPLIQFYFYAENNQAGAFLPERAEHEFFTIEANVPLAKLGDLVINELVPVNSKGIFNEKGKIKDWFELGNNTNQFLKLSGFNLSDDLQNFRKWSFPDDAYISPNGHLLVWADGENSSYLNHHTNFSLSGSGGNLILSYNGQIVDQTSYSTIKTDFSSGRCPDLTGDFQTISKVTPGEVNYCLSFSEDLSINKINIFPVPTFGEIAIHSEVGIREVQLLNCFGTFVKELKEGVSDLCDLPSGVYILKIIDINNKEYINKISKL